MMTHAFISGLVLWLGLAAAPGQVSTNTPTMLFASGIGRLLGLMQAPTNGPAPTFTTTLKILKASGPLKELADRQVDLAFQAPDHIKVSGEVLGQTLTLGRDGSRVWVYAPKKAFGLIGSPEVPMFTGIPASVDKSPLGPLKLPEAEKLAALPFLVDVQALPDEPVGGVPARALSATLKPEAMAALELPKITLRLWLRESDSMPLRIGYEDPKGAGLDIELVKPALTQDYPAKNWMPDPKPGDKIDTVARAHLTRFFAVAMDMLTASRIPALGPAQGQREVIAREGNGRLERVDGTRVLVLKGSPEEMGRQHGTLMKKEVQDLTRRVLYGVGVGSSFEKGRWFFGELEEAQRRVSPFVDPRYTREMDALAAAAGLPAEEVRLANFFPELFHCSGFAVFGDATVGGKLYHGRVLDYLRGMGLEQNAVVIALQPDQGNAWANVSYAGFVGSVTAMNEKHVAIGEMGGRGEGNWDGKPMAQLVREVMEKANTLEEAVAIMRKGPRTCEYYYVISDAKSRTAVGIAATPTRFEVVKPGQSHPQLPHAIKDAVLMSAGDRYEELARRVQALYGKLDAQGARDLMKRPVCMTSNIHSVLFEPETLDFWVANADSDNPAAHARYTLYNLAKLLETETKP